MLVRVRPLAGLETPRCPLRRLGWGAWAERGLGSSVHSGGPDPGKW